MNTKILSVRLDSLTKKEALEKTSTFLTDSKQHYIVTPNPEFLVAAQKDEKFKEILNQADLSLPDGFGLILWAKILGKSIKERICGSDFVWDIAKLASERGASIYLLGGEKGTAKRTAKVLKNKFPLLQVAGAESGGPAQIFTSPDQILEKFGRASQKLERVKHLDFDPKILERINQTKPDILLVAFGHPKQEYFIKENLTKMPSVKVAMGVGGTFDFISGKIPRSPKVFQKLGLEWLFRLFRQPGRFKRIWQAVFVFSWLVLKEKLC